MKYIDLHTHTTASDGTFSPARVVDMAREAGLAAVAITDHDTTEGLPEALERGRGIGMEVVAGIEISARYSPGSMHLLGYDMDHEDSVFAEKVRMLQESRENRNPRIAENLQNLGFSVTMEEVEKVAGSGLVGRPHFARLMVNKGFVRNLNEAFDLYLAKGKPAYAEKVRMEPFDALKMITEAGGVPILAHPFSLELDEDGLSSLVADMKDAGLAGIEVYYPEHTPKMTDQYLKLAEGLDLTVTGGTDFHGANKKEISLGTGRGDLKVSYEVLDLLRKRKQ